MGSNKELLNLLDQSIKKVNLARSLYESFACIEGTVKPYEKISVNMSFVDDTYKLLEVRDVEERLLTKVIFIDDEINSITNIEYTENKCVIARYCYIVLAADAMYAKVAFLDRGDTTCVIEQLATPSTDKGITIETKRYEDSYIKEDGNGTIAPRNMTEKYENYLKW